MLQYLFQDDLDNIFCNECVNFQSHIKSFKDAEVSKNINDLYLMIRLKYLHSVHSYIDISLRMFLCSSTYTIVSRPHKTQPLNTNPAIYLCPLHSFSLSDFRSYCFLTSFFTPFSDFNLDFVKNFFFYSVFFNNLPNQKCCLHIIYSPPTSAFF